MLVVAIIGTLASIAIPKLRQYTDKAKVARAVGDIEAIQADLAGPEFIDGRLPVTLADIGQGDVLDPWGNPYQYLSFATAAKDQHWGGAEGGTGKPRKDQFLVPLNTSYDLYSLGEDGQTDEDLQADVSRDDVVRAGDGAYIGLASKY